MGPIIIPSITCSDHCTVILLPTDNKPATITNHRIKVEIRSNNRNGKNLLANALFDFDCRPLEAIDDVDLKVAYFNNSITTLLDTFLPAYSVTTTERKPANNRLRIQRFRSFLVSPLQDDQEDHTGLCTILRSAVTPTEACETEDDDFVLVHGSASEPAVFCRTIVRDFKSLPQHRRDRRRGGT
jgi:hypothetical protein